MRNHIEKLFEGFNNIVEEYELRLEGLLDEFKENEETVLLVSRSKWLIVNFEFLYS